MKLKTKNKKFIKALQGNITDTPPIWLMRQAGRYLPEYKKTRAEAGSFLDLCYNSELACEVTLQPIRRYGFDAAILFADILLIPDALGQKLDFKQGEGPLLEPIRSHKDFLCLNKQNIHDTLAPVYETVALLSQRLPDETALIGFCGAPWTVLTYMIGGRGGVDARALTKKIGAESDWFEELIDLVVESSIEYLSCQIEAGAEVVQIFDSWAGDLSGEEFEKWSIAPTRKIVHALKERHQDILIIGFPRGAKGKTISYIHETGIDAVSLDSDVSLEWARDKVQKMCPVQGCLDPDILIQGGMPMREAVDELLAYFSGGPYIFNLGHGIKPETPPEHVAELIDIIRG